MSNEYTEIKFKRVNIGTVKSPLYVYDAETPKFDRNGDIDIMKHLKMHFFFVCGIKVRHMRICRALGGGWKLSIATPNSLVFEDWEFMGSKKDLIELVNTRTSYTKSKLNTK